MSASPDAALCCRNSFGLMLADPFFITGPAVISFSGGRTSAYMLWRVLQAHGGRLPDDVVVCFSNTGREMPATLDFVARCASEWGVHVTWLEYRRDPATGHRWAETVSHNSASRNGEPFRLMLAEKKMLPNPVMRFCTGELKVKTVQRYVRAELGWDHWINLVGLRADEPKRVARNRVRLQERWTVAMPLADAGVTKEAVLCFWKAQPFDLELAGPWEGNCDGCFLKGKGSISRMMRDHPERMVWWEESEQLFASTVRTMPKMALFRADRPNYAAMARLTRDQGLIPFLLDEFDPPCDDAGCGT